MTAPDHLPPVTFRLTISQRAFLVYAGLASVLLGAIVLIMGPPMPPPPFVQILAIFLLGIGIFTLGNLNPQTVINALPARSFDQDRRVVFCIMDALLRSQARLTG
jgi:hypothetical protein